jgi:hypothetical protein
VPTAKVEIRLGLRTLAVDDFATLLQDALPELMTLDKAKQAASELVENVSRQLLADAQTGDELGDETVRFC